MLSVKIYPISKDVFIVMHSVYELSYVQFISCQKMILSSPVILSLALWKGKNQSVVKVFSAPDSIRVSVHEI